MESKEKAIKQVETLRDVEIGYKLSTQQQISMIYKFLTGQTTIEAESENIAFVQSIYDSAYAEIDKINAMSEDEFLVYETPSTLL